MTVDRIYDQNEIKFPKLGWTFHIDRTAFTVFGVDIQWYGIIITVGLVLAMIYCFSKMKRFGIDTDRALDVAIVGIIGGLLGARLYYVAFRWDEYKGNLKEIINTRGGGLAIYGGIIGAIGLGLIACRLRKVKILPMLDITVLGFLIGQGIGRWGNFVNQEAFGTNTNSIFGMTGGTIQNRIINETNFLDGEMQAHGLDVAVDKMVHPCFLYESFWCLLGFVLISWYSKHRKYDGQIFLMYLTWYGAERAFVEGLRTDSLYIGNSNLRVSQVLSAIVCIAAIILQIVFFLKRRRDPEAFVLYANTEESRRLIEESRRKRMGMPPEDELGDDDDDISLDDIDDDDDDDDYDGIIGGDDEEDDDDDQDDEDALDDEAEDNDKEDE